MLTQTDRSPFGGDAPLGRVLRCWGKTDAEEGRFHPALFHMLDVGHVARELLDRDASPRWRRVLAGALACDADSLAGWLPWFIALHDIGKISAAFQGMNTEQRSRMQAEGFPFGRWQWSQELYHPAVSQVFIADELARLPGMSLPDEIRRVWREVTQAHHGEFASPDALRQARGRLRTAEPHAWVELRAAAAAALRALLCTHPPEIWTTPANISVAIMTLTGFTILCDWLGSNTDYFPAQPDVAVDAYNEESRRRAARAIEASGFRAATTSSAPTDFAALFRDLPPPRPLQRAIDALPADRLAAPCLAIIEAPTGEGKTEAALALAHRLAQAAGEDELYYALPTMATSNQMFGRLKKHLRDRLELSAQVKLVHGQAFLVEDDLNVSAGADPAARAALEWFGPRKRALLAPFGVGTVDQVELAALNVRHVALRMEGLAGKVIILDEVHAYDTYMTTIIERLLNWLSAIGTSVIILSATLPTTQRSKLMQAYGCRDQGNDATHMAYPSVCLVSKIGTHRIAPPAQMPDRRLGLRTLDLPDQDTTAQGRWLVQQAADGGCVCWITNTVARAQKLFRVINELAPPTTDRSLLHASFPLDERQMGEEKITAQYGPEGMRPRSGIVIGTQVLEQSLDLDFDLMVSDLAPIDLLLQRAGRLHRHARERPPAHTEPYLIIAAKGESGDEVGLSKANLAVYDEFVLRRTWAALSDRSEIHLPADYRPLVEFVYGAAEPAPDDPLAAAWQKLRDKESDAREQAEARLLPVPDAVDPFCGAAARLTFEENENGAAWIIAQTRLGEESLTVIPVERQGDAVCFTSDGQTIRVPLGQEADRRTQLLMRRRSLRVSHKGIVRALKMQDAKPLPLFDSPLLKECQPLWLSGGQADFHSGATVYHVTLDPKLGLVIERASKGDS